MFYGRHNRPTRKSKPSTDVAVEPELEPNADVVNKPSTEVATEPPDDVHMRPTCKSKRSQQDMPAEKHIRTRRKICVPRRYL